jgi:hypothetical protein
MKASYQPIGEQHIVVDTSKESPSINAAKIINHISRMDIESNEKLNV